MRAELLDRGLDDMLMLSEMASVAARHLNEPLDSPPVADTTVEIIGGLLESGSAIVGDVTRLPEGLLAVQSWDLGPPEATRRIRGEWTAIGVLKALGQVCWLELTESGRAEAEKHRA